MALEGPAAAAMRPAMAKKPKIWTFNSTDAGYPNDPRNSLDLSKISATFLAVEHLPEITECRKIDSGPNQPERDSTSEKELISEKRENDARDTRNNQ